ncbi:MAG: glycosyltransferase [Planctomycetes bacterium]|nr:glycosyltransferase [Planctomycetota bacterium]
MSAAPAFDGSASGGSAFGGPVVHVDTERGFSGGEVQVLLLMEGLRQRAVPQLLCAPPRSAFAEVAKQRGFDVLELALSHQLDALGVWRLSRALRSASLAHLHTGRATWLGSLAAKLAGCPTVITRRMDRRVKRGLRTRFAYGRAAAVVAISPSVHDSLIAGGVDAARIVTIPDALDPARLVEQKGRAATRAELAVGDDQLLLLALAQLVHRKGLDVLLQALSRIDDPRVVCAIAGDGPEAGALRTQAAQLGVAERVRFLGTRKDAGDLLAACDVSCLPSRAEGMGVAALEALGKARAVVATAVGGLGQLIVDGTSGLLVPPDDPAALAAALQRVIADPALRERLAAAGPRRVDEGYRPQQYVDRHVALYVDVLARR